MYSKRFNYNSFKMVELLEECHCTGGAKAPCVGKGVYAESGCALSDGEHGGNQKRDGAMTIISYNYVVILLDELIVSGKGPLPKLWTEFPDTGAK